MRISANRHRIAMTTTQAAPAGLASEPPTDRVAFLPAISILETARGVDFYFLRSLPCGFVSL